MCVFISSVNEIFVIEDLNPTLPKINICLWYDENWKRNSNEMIMISFMLMIYYDCFGREKDGKWGCGAHKSGVKGQIGRCKRWNDGQLCAQMGAGAGSGSTDDGAAWHWVLTPTLGESGL